MIRTYMDSGALITAYRGSAPPSMRAISILNDPNREFVTSEFVRLEVMPKPKYFQRSDEIAFYEAYFASAVMSAPITPNLVQLALTRASAFGLSAVDALHIAAAETLQANEIVTSERPTSPLLRVTTIQVISLVSHPQHP